MNANLALLTHTLSALERKSVRVVRVKNELDECGYCGAPDRFGDFNVQTINGVRIANCETCADLVR